MLGNCSTRDGRSRATGPTAPHVTWTAPAPASSPSFTSVRALAADTSDTVYVVSGGAGTGDADVEWAARFDAKTGAVLWTRTVASTAPTAPFLGASGSLEGYAGASTALLLDTFAPATGAPTSLSLGPTLNRPGPPAIGTDGSLYVAYSRVFGTRNIDAVVSRIRRYGTLAWTSANLDGDASVYEIVSASAVALGPGDLVIATGPSGATTSNVTALDPASGGVLWTTPIPGQLWGGPAVGADGPVVVVGGTATVYVLESNGAVRSSTDLPDAYSISRSGATARRWSGST